MIFLLILTVFAAVFAVVVSVLWFIRLVRVWTGEIAATDVMMWMFLLLTVSLMTASIFLVRGAFAVAAGV